jgi:hypothetical protein
MYVIFCGSRLYEKLVTLGIFKQKKWSH